uniref:CCHC-type domain-containing protein n=1 Tax=Fagus sylvatica TaxID=28930 RepID=A0A2N9F5Y1_FAGSY
MAAIPTSTTDSPIITINAATTINEKLTPSTFPQWRAQFEALLIGYDLIDFVTGVKKCPAIDTTDPTASKSANSHWVRQDKLILHAILASTSTNITPLLAAYKISHEAWTALTRLYAGKSRTRAMQLKEDLTLSIRGTRTVTEFLRAIKVIADELAIIDHPVSDDDLTLYILNGLGPEFREIAAPIRARETSLKFEEIHDLLVGHESYLRRLENQSAATFVPTANYSHRQGGAPGQHQPSPKSSSHKPRSNHGHHKNGPSYSGQRKYRPKCQWCDQMGHTAKNCPKMSSADFTANCAASSQGKNQKWLVDSAASHNMTTELSNLSINSEYDGTDEVDRITGATLLKGECEDGVYPFPEHPPPNFKHAVAYVHERQFPFQKSNPHSPVPISNLPATQDSSVPISLPHVLLAPPGHAASPEVGAVLSPSSANGSSPAPPPLQVSTLSSPSFISSQNSPLEMPAPAVPPNNAVRPHRMTTRSMNNIYKPKKSFVVTKYPLPPSLEPTSVTEALTDSRWRDAMSSELTALMRHNTWQLVPPPADCNIVGCKWVFRIKRHADGSIDRFKARLVAKGFNQRPGLDYKETFSPVVKPVTIRTVLTLAVMYGWSLRQLDVNNAFLHGHLTEKVYMKQPPGFTSPEHPNHICCLTKAIYGLKQAPRAWFSALKQALLEFGFINAKSDSSLFVFHDGSILAYCLVYVDDLILTGNNSTFVTSIIDQLGQKFSLKDLGPLHFFLGVEVIPTKEGLFLTQHKYIRDMLSKTSMDGAKDVTTPLSTSVSLKLADGSSSVDSTEYRRVIGALQYLSLTRPDISFAVNKLSQFMHSPTQTHWTATKRLLRYLKNTIFHGINIRKTSSPALTCFSDADWAGSLDDRKSTSAYLIFLGHTPISWSSKKQRAIARSSTEAEYRALATAAAESMWLLSLFQETEVYTNSTTYTLV